jgi:mannose-1-phosphate guanylyltransferase
VTDNYIKTAFILGAGQGTRLRPLTDSCPKPLLPVGGRPIITYAMEQLLALGVERFIVNTHHLAPVYDLVFPGKQWRGIPVIFRYEPLLLDTAGGLKNIEDLLEGDDDLLVYNGDVISDLPLRRLLEAHQEAGKEVTLALRSSGEPLNVCLNEQNEVCDLRGELGGQGKKCLFTGIYAVKKSFLGRLQPGRPESVITVFLDMIREMPGSVAGVIIDEGRWYDAGSLEEYEKLNKLLSETSKPATKEGAR